MRVTALATPVELNRSDAALRALHIDIRPGADLVSIAPPARTLIGTTTS